MPLIIGDSGATTLTGSGDADFLYGFDPEAVGAAPAALPAVRVAAGLVEPTLLLAAPNPGGPAGDKVFILEKAGVIKVMDPRTGEIQAEPFLDLSDRIFVQPGDERGLLGMAFAPDYEARGTDEHRFYVSFTNLQGDSEVVSFARSATIDPDGPYTADPDSAQSVILVDQPEGLGNHKAGWLEFAPDGTLFWALGDGGGSGDPANRAQNLDLLLGKILRLDVGGDDFPDDPGANYAIPVDNPFVGVEGRDEIWAYGLRNPFRNSFDPVTGELWIADVGENAVEEINLGEAGANYGWPFFEGDQPFRPEGSEGLDLTEPIFTYGRDVGSAIVGGHVYRGSHPGLQGGFVFGDLTGELLVLTENPEVEGAFEASSLTDLFAPDVGALDVLSSFGLDAAGDLYLLDFLDGEVFRLEPDAAEVDGADQLSGGAGADRLFAGAGDDLASGAAGADRLFGMAGADDLFAGAGADLAAGGAGDDFADGGAGADLVSGDDGDDILLGGAGDDLLAGGLGDDLLEGGFDDDRMAGGAGADLFRFVSRGSGVDVIEDFVAGEDRIAFETLVFADFDAVAAAATQDGEDVVIALTNANSVRLLGVDLAGLSAGDFLFG